MATWLPGIPGDSVDHFFASMIVSDVRMPHTTQAMSPIVFTNFMSRNQIYTIRLMDAYNDANKFWRRYLEANPAIVNEVMKKYVDLDTIYEDKGGWCPLINHFLRIADVANIHNPYYQMHYLSLASSIFYAECDKCDQASELYRQRNIFNDVITPILYDPIIPTNYVFMPVMNYQDVRFQDRISILTARVRNFIEGHRSTINHDELDSKYSGLLQKWAEETITEVNKLKYDDIERWKRMGTFFFSKVNTLHSDLKLFEMYPSFERDGMTAMRLLKTCTRIEKRFSNGRYDDDPSEFIDDLLDVRIKQGGG